MQIHPGARQITPPFTYSVDAQGIKNCLVGRIGTILFVTKYFIWGMP